MAKLVVLITAQSETARDVGVAWKSAGAPGVTFLDGQGLQTLRQAAESMEILSGTTSMLDILRQTTTEVTVALSVIQDDALAPELVRLTQSLLGDMDAPDKGILFVVNVEQAFGVSRLPSD